MAYSNQTESDFDDDWYDHIRQNNNYGLSTSVDLFRGFIKLNRVKKLNHGHTNRKEKGI